jgi:hypothetical protein
MYVQELATRLDLLMLELSEHLPALAALPNLPPAPADWASLLHVGPSSFKLLYSLQIVDCLMIGEHGASDSVVGGGGDGAPWCNAFVARGGLAQLLAILMPRSDHDELLHPTRGSQRKPCLVLLLRLLCQFLLKSPSLSADALPIAPNELPELSPHAPRHADADERARATLPTSFGARPFWARRSFSPLSPGELSANARTPEFSRRLMQLVEKVAAYGTADADDAAADDDADSSKAADNGRRVELTLDRPAAEGSEEALDVAICREVLQLLVGCCLSEQAVCAELLHNGPRLASWLHRILLRCPNVEVRMRELAIRAPYARTCAAVSCSCSSIPSSSLAHPCSLSNPIFGRCALSSSALCMRSPVVSPSPPPPLMAHPMPPRRVTHERAPPPPSAQLCWRRCSSICHVYRASRPPPHARRSILSCCTPCSSLRSVLPRPRLGRRQAPTWRSQM